MTYTRQIPRFLAVGVINTLVDFAIFAVLTFGGVAPVPANIASYGCGILTSYSLNSSWTFAPADGPKHSWPRFLGTIGASLAVLALSTLLVATFARMMPVLLAKVIATVVTTAVNFLVLRRILGR
jgi:putative flippase GtrA